MDSAIAATLTTRWLAQTDPAIRRAFLEACTLRHFADGEMIYGFEQEQNCIWGVVSGAIRLFVAMSEQDPKLSHCAGPGFWFGAAPVITGGNRSMQVMAAGNVRLCSIDRSVVVNMAEKNPDVWRSVASRPTVLPAITASSPASASAVQTCVRTKTPLGSVT